VFAGLDYGYYVITSTQDDGKAISVDSTNPDATIIDKNKTTPVTDLNKSIDEDDVFIGQIVTYTISFKTANYDGDKQIVSYEVNDTPATGSLTDIRITSIEVDGEAIDDAPTTFDDNEITIPWIDDDGASLYRNGAELTITYTATVASTAQIDGDGNTNTVTVRPVLDDGTPSEPSEYTDSETFYTYAIAIKKVDQSGGDLAGATFQLPFYVNATADDDGIYTYAGTEEAEGLTNSLVTPDDGLIIIKGVKSGSYSITETAAPAGYNQLTSPVTVTATKTGETTTSVTTYLDEEGNIVDQQVTGGSTVLVSLDDIAATPVVIVNRPGVAMPSTGGIGTTIFYIVGGLLIMGSVVALLAKHRTDDSE
jgi:LPXTG-motif cell wall-anchored protein